MFTGNLNFEKVNLKTNYKKANGKEFIYLRLSKGKYNQFCVPSHLMRKAGFKKGDRVDLLQCGRLFALEKSNTGLLCFKNSGSDSGLICSVSLCAHLRANSGFKTEFDAWVDDDKIIFKPKEESEVKNA